MTFPDFDSLSKTRNINYHIQNVQHFFTFLAPRNLNRKTLKLFFSLNQRLSIRPFGRHDKSISKQDRNNINDPQKKSSTCKIKIVDILLHAASLKF